jgi:hypothetical protein
MSDENRKEVELSAPTETRLQDGDENRKRRNQKLVLDWIVGEGDGEKTVGSVRWTGLLETDGREELN